MSDISSLQDFIIDEDSALGTASTDDEEVIKTRSIPEDMIGEDSDSDTSYSVEKITGHKYVQGKLYFQVKWDDYGENEATFEPEENLIKSANLVHQYIKETNKTLPPKKKITTSLSDTRGKGGSSGPTGTNTELWLSFDEIKKFVEVYRTRNAYQHSDIPIEKFTNSLEEGAIYVDLHRDHFFVLKPEADRCYIADANNTYINNPTVRKELDPKYCTALEPIFVKTQARIDECGGFAAIIILEFLRSVKRRTIIFPRYLLDIVRKRFHKGSLPAIAKTEYRETLGEKCWVKCPECPRKFRVSARLALANHQRVHGTPKN